jgi:hypothetical protein
MKHAGVVLLLVINILFGCFLFYQTNTRHEFPVQISEYSRSDFISALNALQTQLQQLSAHDIEQSKSQFAKISIIHCQLAANISAVIGNSDVLCPNEKAQSSTKLSISEQNSGLRKVLLADDADRVTADASKSSAEKLAAALEWTRRREQGLLEKVKKQTQEIAQLRFSADESVGVPTHASAAKRSNQTFAASPWPTDSHTCDGDSPEFRMLFSPEGSFEGGLQDGSRIDGIIQRELIQHKYHVTMCTNAGGLSGVFRIHKLLDCDETEYRTDDAELARTVRELGPDEFMLNLVGPEMHSLIPQMKYRGSCRCRAPSVLSASGSLSSVRAVLECVRKPSLRFSIQPSPLIHRAPLPPLRSSLPSTPAPRSRSVHSLSVPLSCTLDT